jgi:drug/metabolite transporter (DMT)-like permease
LNVARVLVTTALFWLMVPFERRDRPVDRRDWLTILACALTGVTINQLLFIRGLSMTYATHASLIQLATPIMIPVFAWIFLREPIGSRRSLGLLMGVTGAALLILRRVDGSSADDVMAGNIMILLNAVSYSVYFILAKPLMAKYAPARFMRWVFTIGTCIITPIGWNEFTQADWASFTPQAWFSVGFVVIGATFLAYMFNIYALKHLDAGAIGSYIYLQPVMAAMVATLWYDEPFTFSQAISAALIFAGVYLVNQRKPKQTSA